VGLESLGSVDSHFKPS